MAGNRDDSGLQLAWRLLASSMDQSGTRLGSDARGFDDGEGGGGSWPSATALAAGLAAMAAHQNSAQRGGATGCPAGPGPSNTAHTPTPTTTTTSTRGRGRGRGRRRAQSQNGIGSQHKEAKNQQHATDACAGIAEQILRRWQRCQDEIKSKIVTCDTEEWQKLRLTISPAEFGGWFSVDSTCPRPLMYVGGVDLSFLRGDNVNACASLVVCRVPDLQVVYEESQWVVLNAPYIPGFLAFRESPFLVEAVRRLKLTKPELTPQVLLVDGNGVLHPQECGAACHVGVELDIPTVGVAKSLFYVDGLQRDDEHRRQVSCLSRKGDAFPLVGQSSKLLGMALKTCEKATKPVYVSVGHRISLETAVWLVALCSRHRIPEPVRQADVRSRKFLHRRVPRQSSSRISPSAR